MSDTEEEANLGTEYGLLIQEMTYCPDATFSPLLDIVRSSSVPLQPSPLLNNLLEYFQSTVEPLLVKWLEQSAEDVEYAVDFQSHLALYYSFVNRLPEFLCCVAYVTAWHSKPTSSSAPVTPSVPKEKSKIQATPIK